MSVELESHVERFNQDSLAIGLNLASDQLGQFSAFHAALYEANRVMNLTRISEAEAWDKHFLDSLLFQDLIPIRAKVLDLGTGPGFPAWPLACARPDLKVTALDSSGKMLGFLRQHPLPNLEIVQARAEEWLVRDRFEVVTGRAIAPLSSQLEVSAGPCSVGGWIIPMRTSGEVFEGIDWERLGLALRQVSTRPLGRTDIIRAFPVFEKVKPTPRLYPRRWAELKAKPL